MSLSAILRANAKATTMAPEAGPRNRLSTRSKHRLGLQGAALQMIVGFATAPSGGIELLEGGVAQGDTDASRTRIVSKEATPEPLSRSR
jgi:hypothetical protein